MDLKWIMIPIVALATLGFITSLGYRGTVYPQETPEVRNSYGSNIYDSKDRISIKGVNLKIKFVRGDQIFVSNVDKVDMRGNEIDIETPKFPFRSDVTIEIGNDVKYDDIRISGVRIDIDGKVKTDNLDINGTSININSDLDSDNINISGTGVNVRGLINTDVFRISGTGINLNFKTGNLDKMIVSSTGVSGNIVFLDRWNDNTRITISSLGGNIDFEIPTGSRGYLDINTSGTIRTNTKYY